MTLQFKRWILLSVCALSAACSGDESQLRFRSIDPGITFSPMYSAYGGSHVYALTPSVPSAATPTSADWQDGDPVVASTLIWHADEQLARLEPFDALRGAIKVTTRRAGFTDVEVQGEYRRGLAFAVRARLHITKANDEDWDRGEARYHSGPQPTLTTLLASINNRKLDDGTRDCLLSDTRTVLPQDSACAACHTETSTPDSVMVTPMQTAGYSDDQLLTIITQGQKPSGGTFNSELLRDDPNAECVFAKFHAWAVDEQDKPGLVLKMRSLAPQVSEPLDLERLRAEADAL